MAKHGYTHIVELTHEDLTEATADTDQTIQAISVKAGQAVTQCGFFLETPFEDASDAALNDTKISVGDTDTDRFLTATQVNKNGTEVIHSITANAVDTLPYAFPADDTIDITVESMSAKSLVNIDTGKVFIGLRIVDLVALADART